MSKLYRTDATLRFIGADLDPEAISNLLSATPTHAVSKGGVWFTSLGKQKTATIGTWQLEVQSRYPGNLDAQIAEIFAALSSDLAVWEHLTNRFKADVFCGLFMAAWNEGMSLAPETLTAVGSRGLTLDMDVYEPREAAQWVKSVPSLRDSNGMTSVDTALMKADRATLLHFISQLTNHLTVRARAHYDDRESYARLIETNEAIHRVSAHLRDLLDEHEPMTKSRAGALSADANLLPPSMLSELVLWARI